MEIVNFMTTMFFLFLLAATPSLSSSKGRASENSNGGIDDIVYEIDYRGPETHSSHHISPPDHSHGRRPWIIHHHRHQLLQPKQPNSLDPTPHP
ncbi:hypothetical protein Csa_003970 [Cucumis sativus]|uniref:Uncharacterized protein n=1 Tax=Cucumis sativus TaxID=3659 RepID=A0A0A0KIB6_CUCSA|nr:hypothetical protein Csa_003970 [Cucumis sativus]